MKKYEAEQKLKKKQKTTSVHYEKSWITILFWIFIAVIFISVIISGDFWNAWHGMETKRFDIDILHMYDNLLPKQKPLYVSTIGNANILSNFLCVFAPVAMGLYLHAKEKPDEFLYGWLVVLCVMAGLASNSDSFFLGFGGALADERAFKREKVMFKSTCEVLFFLCLDKVCVIMLAVFY